MTSWRLMKIIKAVIWNSLWHPAVRYLEISPIQIRSQPAIKTTQKQDNYSTWISTKTMRQVNSKINSGSNRAYPINFCNMRIQTPLAVWIRYTGEWNQKKISFEVSHVCGSLWCVCRLWSVRAVSTGPAVNFTMINGVTAWAKSESCWPHRGPKQSRTGDQLLSVPYKVLQKSALRDGRCTCITAQQFCLIELNHSKMRLW